jgi:hypothetical protein
VSFDSGAASATDIGGGCVDSFGGLKFWQRKIAEDRFALAQILGQRVQIAVKSLLPTEDCGCLGRVWNRRCVVEERAHPQPDHFLEDLNLQRQPLVQPAQRMEVSLDRLEDFLFALAAIADNSDSLAASATTADIESFISLGALPGGQQHLLLQKTESWVFRSLIVYSLSE